MCIIRVRARVVYSVQPRRCVKQQSPVVLKKKNLDERCEFHYHDLYMHNKCARAGRWVACVKQERKRAKSKSSPSTEASIYIYIYI